MTEYCEICDGFGTDGFDVDTGEPEECSFCHGTGDSFNNSQSVQKGKGDKDEQ